MGTIIKYKYLILSIIGNIIFLYVSYLQFSTIKITMIHFIAGIIPLIYSVIKHVIKPLLK